MANQSQAASGPGHRVLHLIKGLGRGGAEMLLAEGLRHADRRRFEYSYAFLVSWKDHLVADLEAQGAAVRCFAADRPARLPLAAIRLARHLRSSRTALLHCHLPLTGVVGRLAARLAGVPVVYTEHNLMERYHPWTRRANCLTWRLQDRVVAVSEGVAAAIRRHVGESVPVRVVHNGVDTGHFRPDPGAGRELRRRLGIPDAAPVVGTVAVFRRQKRLDIWLRAFRQVRSELPGARGLLVGDGPLRQEVERLAEALELGGSIHFAGLQEDVRPYLAAMDLYLISSRFEGLPVALLEAMAMELPVVSTDVGGVGEVLEEGASGRLVADPGPEALAHAAAGMLREPEARRAMGGAARRRISEGFSMRRMSRDLEEIYLELLEGGDG